MENLSWQILIRLLIATAAINSVVEGVFYPPFIPFNFTNIEDPFFAHDFCTTNGTLGYDEVFDILTNESWALLDLFADGGGLKQYFLDHAAEVQTNGIPDGIRDLIENSPLWDALECCQHPTSFLNMTFNFGCPRNVSVCVFDPRVDLTDEVMAVFRPAGCCPVESPNGCFSRRAGGGLEGCCPDHKKYCSYHPIDGSWLGCVTDHVESCGDKICPHGYTCCKGKHSTGNICCPRYGGSCFDDDYFAYGLNRSSAIAGEWDDTDPDEQPVKLSDFFDLVYQYHGCIPAPGGELGPVKNLLYITDPTERYADEWCEGKSERTTHRIRPHLRRVALAPEDLDSDGIPHFTFNGINPDHFNLNISFDAAKFGGLGDLDFTPCGRHLCYGERDFCVKRYSNRTIPVGHRVINVTQVIIDYEIVLEQALNDTDDEFEPPEPIDLEFLLELNETCYQYNDTYLAQLIDDGIYDGLLTGEGVNPQVQYLLPTECLLFDLEYELEEYELGCCPHNSTPCAAAPWTLDPDIPAEWPRLYSIFDPLYGCAQEGEECCGRAICPQGFKCCDIRFTADGGLSSIVPNGEDITSGHLTDYYLRPGLLWDLLENHTAYEKTYITDILDVRHKCCPIYSFCCQVETSFDNVAKTGKRFHYYCATDPTCTTSIWNTGKSGTTGGIQRHVKGYPSQMRQDDLSLDHNGDGTFDFVTDILEVYLRDYPHIYQTNFFDRRRDHSGSALLDVKCTLTTDVGPMMECGQLTGDFALPPPSPSPSPTRRGVRAIGGNHHIPLEKRSQSKRHIDNLDHYPPPPESWTSPLRKFDILGTEVVVNTTDIFSMESPLGYFFRQMSDYTEQLVLEAFFGLTFHGFPPEEIWEPPEE